MESRTAANVLSHTVSAYNAQKEGMALIAGWKVEAQVIATSGRRFAPVTIAVCSDKADAEEIAAFYNAKYGGAE